MQRLDDLRDRIKRQMESNSARSPFDTPIDGVILLEARTERHPTHVIHKPALCIVVQGAKWTTFGNRRIDYRAGQAMVVGVHMPGFSQVIEGSDGAPYYSVVIELDQSILRDVYRALDNTPQPLDDHQAGAFVIDLDDRLVDCAIRLLDLLDRPDGIAILYPGVMRELCFWLLTGEHGAKIARTVAGKHETQRLDRVIHVIRDRFDEALPLEKLAAIADLSPSTFHRRFKALTAMTPLNYQKRLRLLEARRLLITDRLAAETAAFQVGYASPSQFSRDYTRMFGAPPRTDIDRLEVGAPEPDFVRPKP